MLTNSEFLIISITVLTAVVFVNPLMLLEGFSNLLQRQKKMPPIKEIEEKLLSRQQATLEKIEKQVQTEVREELAKMANKHTETLAKLVTGIAGDYRRTHQELRTTADQHLKDTQLALAEVVKKAEGQVEENFAQELEKARAEIHAYKERQLQKIDAEIASLVEKTIYKTLGKGFSREDQLDLIYKSLAEAKEEGFFGKDAN